MKKPSGFATVFEFSYLLVWGYISDLSMVPRLRRGHLACRAQPSYTAPDWVSPPPPAPRRAPPPSRPWHSQRLGTRPAAGSASPLTAPCGPCAGVEFIRATRRVWAASLPRTRRPLAGRLTAHGSLPCSPPPPRVPAPPRLPPLLTRTPRRRRSGTGRAATAHRSLLRPSVARAARALPPLPPPLPPLRPSLSVSHEVCGVCARSVCTAGIPPLRAAAPAPTPARAPALPFAPFPVFMSALSVREWMCDPVRV